MDLTIFFYKKGYFLIKRFAYFDKVTALYKNFYLRIRNLGIELVVENIFLNNQQQYP